MIYIIIWFALYSNHFKSIIKYWTCNFDHILLMKTFKTFYFTKLASEHFGETMGIIINTLDKYGPMKYSDIIKYTSFDNLKFLEIAITLGIKH